MQAECKEQPNTSTAGPMDTLVGTVGTETKIQQEKTGLATTRFSITTFGHPLEIEVEYTWEPSQERGPDIKPGMDLRFWGQLYQDEQQPRMSAERVESPGARDLKVLVCGGRKFAGWRALEQALDLVGPDIIIHGAAPGADSLAGRYAQENEVECRSFPAKWKVRDKNGRWFTDRGAGHKRNQQMLDEGNPDLVMAFPRRPRHQEHGEDKPAAGIPGDGDEPPGTPGARQDPTGGAGITMVYQDDNFGNYQIRSQEDLEFFQRNQDRSVEKTCEGCGRRVKLLPRHAYCSRCADLLE